MPPPAPPRRTPHPPTLFPPSASTAEVTAQVTEDDGQTGTSSPVQRAHKQPRILFCGTCCPVESAWRRCCTQAECRKQAGQHNALTRAQWTLGPYLITDHCLRGAKELSHHRTVGKEHLGTAAAHCMIANLTICAPAPPPPPTHQPTPAPHSRSQEPLGGTTLDVEHGRRVGLGCCCSLREPPPPSFVPPPPLCPKCL